MSTDLNPAPAAADAASGPFPDAPRVQYDRPPLVEVICQIRFPPVLRIDTTSPAEFQDRIRHAFPLYTGPEPDSLLGGMSLPEEMAQLVRTNFPAALRAKPHAFASADEGWTVTLSKDFLALRTTKYLRWDNFRLHLEPAISALEQVYEPAFYSRIGLRYRNVIRRSSLGLESRAWPELLRHQLAGELSAPEISEHVEKTARQTLVRLPEYGSKVQMRHGLTLDQGEMCYLIDNDFFTEQQTERSNAFTALQYFNAQAHRLFRWCISDRLHEALGPRAVQ